MLRRSGARFLIVGLLTLLMAIPLFLVAAVVGDRLNYARSAQRAVAQEWGGPQQVVGPRIVLPVLATIIQTETQHLPEGVTGTPTTRQVTRQVPASPLVILPEQFDLTVTTESETRRRGIFIVPVYTAQIGFEAQFTLPETASMLQAGEVVQWSAARLEVDITSNTGLRGSARVTRDGEALTLEPLTNGDNTYRRSEGIVAMIGDPRTGEGLYAGQLTLRGAESLRFAPVGRVTHASISGDWPHPGFAGALPDSHSVTAGGFAADWTIPHLARPMPQVSRTYGSEVAVSSFGLSYVQPNDFYQKAFRATRYAILLIALTFLTVFLVEGRTGRPAHPVQYILIGLAQSLFVLLMVAYAEHFGFGLAYLGASVATIALLTLFGATGLKLGRRAWVMSALLIVLYAVLWLILQSADYALLAGATLAFIALTATMIVTRNEDWYGPPAPVPTPAPAPAPAAAPVSPAAAVPTPAPLPDQKADGGT